MRGSPRLEIELHVDGISFRQRAASLLFIKPPLIVHLPAAELTSRFVSRGIHFLLFCASLRIESEIEDNVFDAELDKFVREE